MSLSPQRLVRVMSEVQQLLASLPPDDRILRRDGLEGETQYFEALDDYAEAVIGDARMVEMAKARIKRIEARIERNRHVVQRILELAYLDNAERPLYTVTLTHHRELQIVSEADLPDEYWRHAPDKIAIAKALRGGNDVPGATLGNAQPRLTILAKEQMVEGET